jgi:hypothetical protein
MKKVISLMIAVLFGINSIASPINEKARFKSAIEKSEVLVRSLPKDLSFKSVSILVSEIFRKEGISLTSNSDQNLQLLSNAGVISKTEIDQAKKILESSELSRMTLNDAENKSLDGVQIALFGMDDIFAYLIIIAVVAAAAGIGEKYFETKKSDEQHELKVECIKLAQSLNENNRDAYNKLCAEVDK